MPTQWAEILVTYTTVCRTQDWRDYFTMAEGYELSHLFIASTKPHQNVTPSTLAKWMLKAMETAGIDTKSFKAHSGRSASSSALVNRGFSLSQILNRANWSDISGTFTRFYDRSQQILQLVWRAEINLFVAKQFYAWGIFKGLNIAYTFQSGHCYPWGLAGLRAAGLASLAGF